MDDDDDVYHFVEVEVKSSRLEILTVRLHDPRTVSHLKGCTGCSGKESNSSSELHFNIVY